MWRNECRDAEKLARRSRQDMPGNEPFYQQEASRDLCVRHAVDSRISIAARCLTVLEANVIEPQRQAGLFLSATLAVAARRTAAVR